MLCTSKETYNKDVLLYIVSTCIMEIHLHCVIPLYINKLYILKIHLHCSANYKKKNRMKSFRWNKTPKKMCLPCTTTTITKMSIELDNVVEKSTKWEKRI